MRRQVESLFRLPPLNLKFGISAMHQPASEKSDCEEPCLMNLEG
jgi:hypothetical protein